MKCYTRNDLAEIPDFPADNIDFGRVIPWKLNLIERAFVRFKSAPSTGSGRRPETARREYDHFCAENGSWLS